MTKFRYQLKFRLEALAAWTLQIQSIRFGIFISDIYNADNQSIGDIRKWNPGCQYIKTDRKMVSHALLKSLHGILLFLLW